MKTATTLLAASTLVLALLATSSRVLAADFTSPPPKGEVTRYVFDSSRIFPGTVRDYWVYVPAEYDPAHPACVLVDQDGIQFNAPAVMDSLIQTGEMPVTIGVFIQPGRVKAPSPEALDRFNRSYEYDGLGDSYARFLLNEVLPAVETKKTADGRPIHLSQSGNDRCIIGSSSGGIAAFTAAWERPDAFSRVFTAIGTYVGLRGGNVYPTFIREYEPKPIRVFLQDGSADQNIYGGDWWMANQEMERALKFAGYEVSHVWGTGGHSGQQGTEIFPDVMRWLWKDWPAPVKAGLGSQPLQEILIPGEGWDRVGGDYPHARGLAANQAGEVFFTVSGEPLQRIGLDGKVVTTPATPEEGVGGSFGADGNLRIADVHSRKILVYDAHGRGKALAAGIAGHDLVARRDGGVYVTSPGADTGRVWFVSPQGRKSVVDTGLRYPTGITLSPDQTLLYVADGGSHWVYSYQVEPDGSLKYKQQYYHLHTPDTADDSGAEGMCVDKDGRLYVATLMGVQVCDQAGRVNCIIPVPGGAVSSVCIGGAGSNILFATSGDGVYQRNIKVKGAYSFEAPTKPAPPRL